VSVTLPILCYPLAMSEKQVVEDVPLRLLARVWSDKDIIMSREEEEGASRAEEGVDVGLLWAADAIYIFNSPPGFSSCISDHGGSINAAQVAKDMHGVAWQRRSYEVSSEFK
jgi:hypothetical protein